MFRSKLRGNEIWSQMLVGAVSRLCPSWIRQWNLMSCLDVNTVISCKEPNSPDGKWHMYTSRRISEVVDDWIEDFL